MRSNGKSEDRQATREFASLKFDWLDQVNADAELAEGDLKSALAISKRINEHTKIGFGGVRDIQKLTSKPLGSIVASIARLEARGHLELVERGRQGRGLSHHFRMIIKVQPAEHLDGENVQPAEHLNVHSGGRRVQIGAKKVRLAEQNTFKNTLERTPSESAKAGRGDSDSVFDYPADAGLRPSKTTGPPPASRQSRSNGDALPLSPEKGTGRKRNPEDDAWDLEPTSGRASEMQKAARRRFK